MAAANLHIYANLTTIHQLYLSILLVWYSVDITKTQSSEKNSVAISFGSNHRLTGLISLIRMKELSRLLSSTHALRINCTFRDGGI